MTANVTFLNSGGPDRRAALPGVSRRGTPPADRNSNRTRMATSVGRAGAPFTCAVLGRLPAGGGLTMRRFAVETCVGPIQACAAPPRRVGAASTGQPQPNCSTKSLPALEGVSGS
jgi:hypothetical protein